MGERSEIAFFDVETTVPFRKGQKLELLEFGVILVCPRKLVEVDSYSSLVRPFDLSSISPSSVRCNGISRDAVAAAPTFHQIADRVYDLLHGRVWAGHNILRFDCLRIREAFADIGRPAPEPKGTFDSLALLTQRFGRRAGDMKMATLATYFGLGQQKHRSLDDVRMNLEVVKYCATVLFLESSLPDVLTMNDLVSPKPSARSRANGNSSPEGTRQDPNSPSASRPRNQGMTSPNIPMVTTDLFDIAPLVDQMKIDPMNLTREEGPVPDLSKSFSNSVTVSEGCSGYAGFLEPDEVSLPCISTSVVPTYRGCKMMLLGHRGVPLQLCCMKMRVRFGVSTKFIDQAGRPRLNIVVEPSPRLCQVLDACDQVAQRSSVDSGSSSEWRAVVVRKNGFANSWTIRLNIPTVTNGDTAIYSTEIYQKEPVSGAAQKLVFSKLDVAELETLFVPGSLVDAYFSLDVYDYQQNAGIRLVAKKLVVDSK